jgi:hypothetical protein
MKIKFKFCLLPFMLIGVCLLISTSCSKDDDNNSKNTVKDIDGNVYHSVTIGTQVWWLKT